MKPSNLGIPFIKQAQRNRFPSLFVDTVLDLVPGESCRVKKNFTYNEWFFPTHFPEEPIVPGYVLLEAMTQALLIAGLGQTEYEGSRTAFVKVSSCEFKKAVIPGDSLISEAQVTSFRRGILNGAVIALVEDTVACRTELVLAVPDAMPKIQPRTSEAADD